MIASMTVQRPSPESATQPLMFFRSEPSCANARSSSSSSSTTTTVNVAQAQALITTNYKGFVDLEYEIHADDPMPGVIESFAYMRGVLAGMGYKSHE